MGLSWSNITWRTLSLLSVCFVYVFVSLVVGVENEWLMNAFLKMIKTDDSVNERWLTGDPFLPAGPGGP